ncbi:MAG: hypothetical protein NTY38_05160 [Acidobacteria bacterium]|nr:hypothetical protein [Acidobacteriota bacterium]
MDDLRTPSGIFFALLGLILIITSLVAPGARAPLTDVNVNLYAGLSMLAFGAILLWLAKRAS